MKQPTFLLAPDSFKESMSATVACAKMAAGVRTIFPDATIISVPVSDGGEGFLDVVMRQAAGYVETIKVTDVFGEEEITATVGFIDEGQTAVIEVASVIGLALVDKKRRDVLRATTFGVGQLLKAALKAGAKKIVLGLGGSSTNDGGFGLARALGYRFIDAAGTEIMALENLAQLAKIDERSVEPQLKNAEIVAATDVTNVLLGERGATQVFAPQKGATPAQMAVLEKSIARLAAVASANLAAVPGAGACGGLGFGLLAFTGAQLISGGDYILQRTKFDEKLRQADYVLTGEGAIDGQTADGKIIFKLAQRAQQCDTPLFALVGTIGADTDSLYAAGVTAIFSIVDRPQVLAAALKNGPENLQRTATNLVRVLKAEKKSPLL